MANDAQSLNDIVIPVQEKQTSSFQEKIQTIQDKFEYLSEKNNKELDKICEDLTKLDNRLRSIQGSSIREKQKLYDHINQYNLNLARIEKRLDDANATIESLKQWRYIQLGAVGVISAIITIIIGATVAYITKQL